MVMFSLLRGQKSNVALADQSLESLGHNRRPRKYRDMEHVVSYPQKGMDRSAPG
jgi:hypothetical protein